MFIVFLLGMKTPITYNYVTGIKSKSQVFFFRLNSAGKSLEQVRITGYQLGYDMFFLLGFKQVNPNSQHIQVGDNLRFHTT